MILNAAIRHTKIRHSYLMLVSLAQCVLHCVRLAMDLNAFCLENKYSR